MKIVLTKEQEDIIKKSIEWDLKTYQEVADLTGLTYTYIRRYVTKHKLKPKYQDKTWLQEQYDTHIHTSVISEKTGFKYDTITLWAKKLHIKKSEKIKMSAQKYTLDENYFETIDTEHKAYWLGFIMADGCITRTEKKYNPNRLEILLKYQNDEIELLKEFQKDINSNHPLNRINNVNKKYDFSADEISLRINSKIFVSHLISNEVTEKKTGKEIIPSTIPRYLLNHFIRGFFDGDGCIKEDGRISLGSSSVTILNQINNILQQELGFQFKIYERTEYKVPFYLFESHNSKQVNMFLIWIYNNSTVYLKRKFNKYLSLVCPPLQ